MSHLAVIGAMLSGLATLVGAVGILIGRIWGSWSDHVVATRDLQDRLKRHADEKAQEAKDAEARADAEEERRRRVEDERGELISKLSSMENELGGVRRELVEVRQQLERLLVSHGDLEAQHESDQVLIEELERELAERDQAIESLETKLTAAECLAETLSEKGQTP